MDENITPIASGMHLKPFDLRDGVNVDVSFAMTRLPSNRDVIVVTVCGRTGIGCSSNTDASYIEGMTRAALSMLRPSALVFDFREFEYEWGDMLAATLCAGDKQYVDSPFPTAVVISDLCRQGLTSLVRDELLMKPEEWLFDTLDLALAAVERQQQEILKRDEEIRRRNADK